MKDLEERDRIRNFQPPITGEVIMQTYGIGPCRAIGDIKEVIKNAILDREIPNDYDAAYADGAAGRGKGIDQSRGPEPVGTLPPRRCIK